MKTQRRAHGGTHLAWILLACGCTVYEPSLLGDRASVSAGGTPAHAGDAGSGGSKDSTAGSAGTASDGGSGAAGTGGSGGGDAGEGSPSAGAETAGDGGAMACVPETPDEFCTRLAKNCGMVDAADNCGNAVVGADCGACSGFEMCGGGGENNVCGVLTDPTLGGTATASSVMFTHENGSKAFDLAANSKWYAGDGTTSGWIAYQFPATDSHVVQSYSVTSANDVPGRDPSAWQLQGSDDGATWVTVDQRSAEAFASRLQTKSYGCSGSIAYRSYRLLITANSGASSLQLAELVLYAN